MYVVLTKLILECIYPGLTASVVLEQCGTKGKAAAQQAILLQDELNAKEGSSALLIDVAKAFPSVPHPVLLHMSELRGHVLAMLHYMYGRCALTTDVTLSHRQKRHRSLPQSMLSPWTHVGLPLLYGASPHTHAHTHRRPKTPPPPSPPAPVPRGLEETVAEDVARPLFVTRHGRANTLDT